jgi:hypothetical protein
MPIESISIKYIVVGLLLLLVLFGRVLQRATSLFVGKEHEAVASNSMRSMASLRRRRK